MIGLVVARAKNGVIGRNNDLPWYIPEDLKHFRRITTGHAVIMGKNTYKSIYDRLQKPLPDRQNIVISHSNEALAEGFELAHSVDEANRLAKGSDVYVIGGAQLYKEYLGQDLVDTVYLTEIDAEVEGDTYFEGFDAEKWQETAREDHASGEWKYSFVTLKRSKNR